MGGVLMVLIGGFHCWEIRREQVVKEVKVCQELTGAIVPVIS